MSSSSRAVLAETRDENCEPEAWLIGRAKISRVSKNLNPPPSKTIMGFAIYLRLYRFLLSQSGQRSSLGSTSALPTALRRRQTYRPLANISSTTSHPFCYRITKPVAPRQKEPKQAKTRPPCLVLVGRRSTLGTLRTVAFSNLLLAVPQIARSSVRR